MPRGANNSCPALSLRGEVCGRPCFGELCCIHRRPNRRPLNPCERGCGRATASISGCCNHCSWGQQVAANRRWVERKAAAEQSTEMDAYIEQLIEGWVV